MRFRGKPPKYNRMMPKQLKRTAVGFLGLVVGVLCLLVAACSFPELELAEQMVQERNWDAAVSAYQEALRKEPFNQELIDKLEEVKEHAAKEHYAKGRQYLKEENMPGALQEFQIALGLQPSQPEHQAALNDTLRLRQAHRSLEEGKNLQNIGRLEEAMEQYERAMEMNPNLYEAMEGITAIAQQQKAHQQIGGSAEPVTLRFQNTRLKQVFEILARTANIDIIFDKDVRDDLVTIFTRDTPFDDALNLILSTNQLFAKRVAPDTLLIVPDTKQKREQYEDLKVRTFYLSNAKAKDMANLLRTILETKRVYVNEPLNTIVVRDQPAKVTLAEHIILANDRRDAEVVFEVEILEVDRDVTRTYGINFAKSAGAGIFPPGTDIASNLFGTLSTFTWKQLPKIGPDSYAFTFPGSILLEFFKNETNAKILASPTLRVLNNQKASINVGDKQPILLSTTNVLPGQASTGVTPTTSTVTSIEFKDVGIKLTVEPNIHLNNELSLKLQIEVTRLGPRVTLQDSPLIQQFRFLTRTADTALNLIDGETVVLGGLLQEDDRKERQTVPGLEDVPFLEDLLSRTDKNKITTEVILVITPHIVRSVTPPSLVKQTMWSGTAKQYDTKPLFTEAEVALPVTNGASFSETQGELESVPEKPAIPPPGTSQPEQPQDTPNHPEKPVQESVLPHGDTTVTSKLNLLPSSLSTKVGEEIRVNLFGEGLPGIEKSQVTINYDPKIIEFNEVLEGECWKQTSTSPHFTVSAVPTLGQIVIQMGQAGKSVCGGGQLAGLIFLAKASGDSPLEIENSSLIGSDAKLVPVVTQHGRILVQ